MEISPGPIVRRFLLGRRLRKLREGSGKSTVDAAKYLGVTQPTISRIENGRHAILPRNVRLMCQLYEVEAPMLDTFVRLAEESDGVEWFAVYGDTVPDWFELFVAFEADAAEIVSYQSENIPGLLQVGDAVRAIRLAARPDVSEDELLQSVQFRLARQRRLESDPPTLRYVLNEAVLRRVVGGPETMAKQIKRLIDLIDHEQAFLTLQVLPFSAGAHPAQAGSFTMLRLPDEPRPNFVYLEHDRGALYLERPADLARYLDIFAQLTKMALSPAATRKFLVSLLPEQ